LGAPDSQIGKVRCCEWRDRCGKSRGENNICLLKFSRTIGASTAALDIPRSCGRPAKARLRDRVLVSLLALWRTAGAAEDEVRPGDQFLKRSHVKLTSGYSVQVPGTLQTQAEGPVPSTSTSRTPVGVRAGACRPRTTRGRL